MISIEKWNGLDAVRASNDFAEAVVILNGGHVVSYVPAGKKDLLWVSQKSNFVDGKPVRGGIPVCWPWFGKVRMPAHGFARFSRWTFECSMEKADATVLQFFLQPSEPEFKEISTSLEISVGKKLTVTLNSLNNGTETFDLTEALHTYFAVADIASTKVLGLENVEYIDRLDSDAKKIQQGAVTFNAETDRIYITKSEAVIDDGTRRIRVSKENSASTVVWNPWIAKAQSMADFGDEEYRNMLCVETANAGNVSLKLEPGKPLSMSTSIELI